MACKLSFFEETGGVPPTGYKYIKEENNVRNVQSLRINKRKGKKKEKKLLQKL